MHNTRFIFVEGIMGSGKSTTAWLLTEHLQRNGIAAQFMSEGGPLRVTLDLPHPNGVWLDVTVEEYIELSLGKWRTFVRGSEWEAYQVNWKVLSPYGVERSLHGFNGLVQLYQADWALCDDIFAQLALPKLTTRNEGEWARYYREILSFLASVLVA